MSNDMRKSGKAHRTQQIFEFGGHGLSFKVFGAQHTQTQSAGDETDVLFIKLKIQIQWDKNYNENGLLKMRCKTQHAFMPISNSVFILFWASSRPEF